MPKRTEADGLHQGRDTAGEQVGVDQQRELIFRQMQRTPQYKRHGDSIGIHDKTCCNPGLHARRRQHLIDWMDGGGHCADP